MKAVILAAGQGTRLRPVTLTMPKPLVPVANKWLIAYAIDELKGANFTDIGIVVNDLSSPVCEIVGDGSVLGVNVTYIIQKEQLGLAHAINLCHDFVGDDPFCVFLGDNIFQDNIRDLLVNFADSDSEATIMLGEVPDPQRFGIGVIDSEGRITEVHEKLQNPPSNLAIVGVYLFRSSVFDAISKIKPSWRNELEITDAIQELIKSNKRVSAYTIQGWWIDAGKPDAIVLANQLVMEDLPWTPSPQETNENISKSSEVSHRVILGENSKIIDSVVRGPVIIGKNTIVKNSYIGPYTSLGDDVVVEGSEIEASIVMKNCVIKDIKGRIDRSLLADNSTVTSAERMPVSHRFVLAENSYIQL